MVWPCSCPASKLRWQGRQRQGARYVFETQHRNRRKLTARHISTLHFSGVRSQQMSKNHPVDQPASAKRNGSDESEHMQRTNVAFVDNTEENSLSTFCDARAKAIKS